MRAAAVIASFGLGLLSAAAQTPPPQPAVNRTPDISITATVTASELIFHTEPKVSVEFSGTHKRNTVWETDRTNLPTPVKPGETYRNIEVRLRITSTFAEIASVLEPLRVAAVPVR